MLNNKMEKALNNHLNAELYSSYLYLAMASWFSQKNLMGFVNWFKTQAMEEMYHGIKVFNFIEERGGKVHLTEIEKPTSEWDNPVAVLEATLEHERMVSARVDDLVTLAMDERDHASNNFLQWFVSEQVEEEATADDLLQKLKLAGDQGSGLFMIDQELMQRAFNIPPDTGINLAGPAK